MSRLVLSIDAKGNLQCPDVNGVLGESFTWVPDQTTVTSVDSITTSIGSFNPAPTAANGWTGILATDGSLPGGGNGVDYTITASAKNGTQKHKSPKIAVPPSGEKTKKSKNLHAKAN